MRSFCSGNGVVMLTGLVDLAYCMLGKTCLLVFSLIVRITAVGTSGSITHIVRLYQEPNTLTS